MDRSSRNNSAFARPRAALLAGALAASLGSCAEIGTAVDVVFPSTVPGLPNEEGWDSLPLRRWLTEPGLQPVAISACFRCPNPAVAGLFQASGQDAALRRAVSDPRALLASLTRDTPAARRGKRASRTRVDVLKAQEGGVPGLAVGLSRGRRRAGGYIATVERPEAMQVLVIVAASEAEARKLARGIVPRL